VKAVAKSSPDVPDILLAEGEGRWGRKGRKRGDWGIQRRRRVALDEATVLRD